MKNVIEILEKQYQSFINQERDWNFFLGLADYVGFINKSVDFKQALNKIKESKSKQIEIIEKFEKEAVNELQRIKRKVLKTIKGNVPHKNKEILEALTKLTDYEKGKIDHTHYKSARLEDGLKNLIKVLCKNGYRNLLNGILPENIKTEDIIKDYSYYRLSEKLSLRWEKSSELSEKEETELWGAYKKLRVVFTAISSGKKFLNTLEKYPDEYDRYLGVLKEIEIIKNDGKRPFFFSFPSSKREEDSFFDYRKKELKKDNYKLYATRIHNYLTQELSSEKQAKVAGLSKQTSETEKLLDELESDIKKGVAIPKTFEIQVRDRYIWINNYLLSKPHAVGNNFEFLERIQAKEPNTEIKRNEFPQLFQEEIKNKTFFQILNALGFKGEVKKAFFYKVSKNSLFFRSNKITKKDLEKAGVNIKVFVKELELAHVRNYPE